MLSKTNTRTAVCAAALLVAAGAFAVRAQDSAAPAQPETPAAPAAQPETPTTPAAQPEAPRNPTDVVARVAGQTVTEAEVEIAREEFAGELQQVPPEQHRRVIIDALVNIKLLAQAARDAKLDQTPGYEMRRQFLELQALRNAYVEDVIVKSLTPEELQKGYEELVVAQHKPEEQVRARHILVETKEEAEKIIADLKGGAAFEELAKQSKDPSGQNGGDLGYFGRGQMVPPFEQAVFALQPGAVTETPVQSEFGWHVIKLEDKRMSEPPKLAEVEDQLRNSLLRGKFEAAMASLREKYPIEIVGQPAPAAGGEAPAGAVDDPPAAPPAGGEAPSAPAEGAQPQN